MQMIKVFLYFKDLLGKNREANQGRGLVPILTSIFLPEFLTHLSLQHAIWKMISLEFDGIK